MTQEERLIAIEEQIKNHGKVTIEEICQTYAISYDSARRDLVKLSERPGILRIRGGAILDEKTVSLSFHQRSGTDPIKLKLANFGASLVEENDIIFLDAGTTCTALAQNLTVKSTVITNSIESLSALSHKPNVRKSVLGGAFDDFSHAILGDMTIEQIKKYQASKAFIGIGAISESGITTDLETDANLKLAMAKQSKQVICVVDSTKFNTQLMYQSCTWADIDIVVTIQRPPENIVKQIERHGVEVVILPEA